MSDHLIHIGYHKTGSTWLQDAIFTHPSLPFVTPWARNSLTRDWIAPHAIQTINSDIIKNYKDVIIKLQKANRVPVFSHERFSGCPATGGYDARLIAERLANAFPDAKILIVIRSQIPMIVSYYKQYIRDGGGAKIEAFLRPPEPTISRAPYFNPKFYCYHEMITMYDRLFGHDRVLVLPYEWMKTEPTAALKRILTHVGHAIPDDFILPKTTINPSLCATSVAKLRVANRWFSRNQLNPLPIIEKPSLHAKLVEHIIKHDNRQDKNKSHMIEKAWKQKTQDLVEDVFRASNQSTIKRIGYNLTDLGYPTH